MQGTRQFLGEFEEFVLLAINKIGENAYGVIIAEMIEDYTGKRVSTGALYTALTRLENKNLISSWLGEKTDERGGRAKKYFQLEVAGKQLIQDSQSIRSKFATI